MSEEKVPAQATIEEQLANAKQEIQWLRNEAQVRKKELRERVFCKIFDGGYERVGHELAIERTAKVVAFILGEDSPAPPREGLLGVQQHNAANRIVEMDNCHKYLDTMGILREGSPGNPFSLEGRIKLLAHLQNEPRMPMIPLEDLRLWIQTETPAIGVGLAGNVGDFSKRRFLHQLASYFGINEVNIENGGGGEGSNLEPQG